MSGYIPGRFAPPYKKVAVLLFSLAITIMVAFRPQRAENQECPPNKGWLSDHFNGEVFFNPGAPDITPQRGPVWLWRFLTGKDWSTWPKQLNGAPGIAPAKRVPYGSIVITPVGHGTFLMQQDGMNILTDPIWSKRCSPVSWAGPQRRCSPGIRFEDLPPIDAVLVSHNHYDHLDTPTLKRLARKGARRAIAPLGNRELISSTGFRDVDEIDWWQSVRISEQVSVTLVPARHFSARYPWDRNKSLWGGFVISGPSGNVYYSGDTGYGPHFKEIARRFSPIRAALLPISPIRSSNSNGSKYLNGIHIGPADAVQAHLDLGAAVSIAAHYQVFQLGADGFDDAPRELKLALEQRHLNPASFLAILPGHRIEISNGSRAARLPDDQ